MLISNHNFTANFKLLGSFHTSKCSLGNFRSRHNCVTRSQESLNLGLLSVYQHQNWDEQINVVCLNLTRRISLLKQLSKYVNMESLKLYYNSYILLIRVYDMELHYG